MDKRFQDSPLPLYEPQDNIEKLDETQQHRDVRSQQQEGLFFLYRYLGVIFLLKGNCIQLSEKRNMFSSESILMID